MVPRTLLVRTLALLLAAALGACTATVTVPAGPAPSADTGGGVAALPASCQARNGGVLPDPTCTPGAADPAVTQANIASTICTRGYTTTVRPPVSYTDPLKRDLIAKYGLHGATGSYELDHLVPLEVGGAPSSVRNLWPESRDTHPGSVEKDHLENLLHDQVCSGKMALADAQRMFEQNWLDAWQRLGRP